MTSTDLSPAERWALQTFAAKYGARWKSRLRHMWETGEYDRGVENLAADLQTIRNRLGPTWLCGVKPQDLEAA